MNPFVSLYHDPVGVLAALGYAALLLALSAGLLAALLWTAARGWKELVWLGNAWEWRGNAQQYGPEWDWYYPPSPVINHAAIVGGLFALSCFVLALWLWAIGGAVYVLGSL